MSVSLPDALRLLARDIVCEDGVATAVISQAADEIDRLRLTDAEREALSRIYDLLNERSRELQAARRIEESTPFVQLAKTVRLMWDRLG
jgi:ribonuclease HII